MVVLKTKKEIDQWYRGVMRAVGTAVLDIEEQVQDGFRPLWMYLAEGCLAAAKFELYQLRGFSEPEIMRVEEEVYRRRRKKEGGRATDRRAEASRDDPLSRSGDDYASCGDDG